MYLLLGNPQDPACARVREALEARNCPTHVIANPMIHPSRFAWRLDSERSVSQLAWQDEFAIQNDQIAGVFVRNIGWIDPAGWQSDDLIYMQSETQAALLAWLWSLPCPVVNRCPSALWYRPRMPLLSWQPLLRHCGLPTLETLVTNVEQEVRDFGRCLVQEGVAGAVYGPLTSDSRYLVASVADWNGLAAMQGYAPVGLAYPHGRTQLVCVVGDNVVWEDGPPPYAATHEAGLRRFAAMAGLAYVELAFAPTSKGMSVVAVEQHPNLQNFGDAARQRIVAGIVNLLTATARDGLSGAATPPQRKTS